MKITEQELRQIIKEEATKTLAEGEDRSWFKTNSQFKDAIKRILTDEFWDRTMASIYDKDKASKRGGAFIVKKEVEDLLAKIENDKNFKTSSTKTKRLNRLYSAARQKIEIKNATFDELKPWEIEETREDFFRVMDEILKNMTEEFSKIWGGRNLGQSKYEIEKELDRMKGAGDNWESFEFDKTSNIGKMIKLYNVGKERFKKEQEDNPEPEKKEQTAAEKAEIILGRYVVQNDKYGAEYHAKIPGIIEAIQKDIDILFPDQQKQRLMTQLMNRALRLYNSTEDNKKVQVSNKKLEDVKKQYGKMKITDKEREQYRKLLRRAELLRQKEEQKSNRDEAEIESLKRLIAKYDAILNYAGKKEEPPQKKGLFSRLFGGNE